MNRRIQPIILLLLGLLASNLGGCVTQPEKQATRPLCPPPSGNNLSLAMSQAKSDLTSGCGSRFDSYFQSLLSIAEGDPKSVNRQAFSEFLLWANGQNLISKRQAQDTYNRFFSVKYNSMLGDYNNCAYTCPRKEQLILDLQAELQDKNRGLVKACGMSGLYQQADQLYKELELVLEATCNACAASR